MKLTAFLCLALCCSCSSFKKMGFEGIKKPVSYFSPRWSKNLDPKHDTGNLPIALQSPLAYRGFVFVGSNDGYMNAYSGETGRPIWRIKEGSPYHSMPTAYKESLIYGNSAGRVFRRNFRDGSLVYAVDLGASVESSPTIYNGRMFVHTRNHKVFALDVETGKILWAYKRSVPQLTTLQRVSKPVVHKGKLYLGFADGTVSALTLEEGVLLWETKVSRSSKFMDVDSEPVMVGPHMIVTSISDTVTVLSLRTGQVVRRIPFAAARSPFILGRHIILGTSDGELVVLNKSYNVIKKVQFAKHGISNISQWGENLVATTVAGDLMVIDAQDFHLIEKKFLGHKSSAVFGRLSIEDETMAVLSSRNRLYVF